MLKLASLLLLIGGIAAAVAWAPIHGRTVLERWRAAPGAQAFVARAYDEVKTAIAGRHEPPPRTARATRPGARPAQRPAAPRPTESHTAEDRAALERIVAEHAGR